MKINKIRMDQMKITIKMKYNNDKYKNTNKIKIKYK